MSKKSKQAKAEAKKLKKKIKQVKHWFTMPPLGVPGIGKSGVIREMDGCDSIDLRGLPCWPTPRSYQDVFTFIDEPDKEIMPTIDNECDLIWEAMIDWSFMCDDYSIAHATAIQLWDLNQ